MPKKVKTEAAASSSSATTTPSQEKSSATTTKTTTTKKKTTSTTLKKSSAASAPSTPSSSAENKATTTSKSKADTTPINSSSSSSVVASPSPSVTKPKKTTKKTKTTSSSTTTSTTSAPTTPQASVPPSPQVINSVPINYAQQAIPLAIPAQFATKVTNNTTPPTNIEVPYQDEISKMLMIFCYCRHDPNSIKIIERYTRNHLVHLISRACEQKSSSTTDIISISPEDILFLFKNNIVKLARIENLIKLKEMRKKEDDTSESDSKKRKLTGLPILKDKKIKYDPILEIGQFSDDEDNDNEKLNYDPFVVYMHEKRKAADFLTKCMSTNEYMEFTKNREATNFISKGTKKFRQWLDISNDIRMNDLVLEILSFEAFETIGTLSQVALISAIDGQHRKISPFEDALFKYAGLLSERNRRMYSQHPQNSIDLSTSRPISTVNNTLLTPHHFLSAITLLHPPSCGKSYNPLKFIVNI